MPSQPFGPVIVFALCVVAGTAVRADAQIYTWRDAHGTLVLSDRPLSSAARSYEVPRSTSVRVTRPVNALRRTAFDALIDQHAAAQGVRADLVRAVIQVESAFNPRARSPKGAMGLMQLMPATASDLGVGDAFDASENIRGGVAYLRTLLSRYGNDEELALAAYNAGPAAVERYGNRVPPYRETRQYVSRIRTSAGDVAPAPATQRIYESAEMVNGRVIPRYSNVASSHVVRRQTPVIAAAVGTTGATPSAEANVAPSTVEETLQALRSPRAKR